jgi:hypothetical protein
MYKRKSESTGIISIVTIIDVVTTSETTYGVSKMNIEQDL